ncbi:MAG: hypothetical protein ACQETL_11390 [Bacteroidota bacterium]
MNNIKTIFLFILISPLFINESFAQKKPLFNIDSILLNGNKITLNSPESFLKTQNVSELNFEEYIEEFPLSSGDKLHYYYDENIKYTLVFYSQNCHLQNITIFSDKPKLIVNRKSLNVGLSKQMFQSKFPNAQFSNDSNPFDGMSSFDLNLGNGSFGNIAFEFSNDKIAKIYLRFIE